MKPPLPNAPNPDHVKTMTTREQVHDYIAGLDAVKEGHYAQMEWFYSASVRHKRWKLSLKTDATYERWNQVRQRRMAKRGARSVAVQKCIREHALLAGKSEEETKHAIAVAVSSIRPHPPGIRERWLTFRHRSLKGRLETISVEPRFEPYPYIWALNQAELKLVEMQAWFKAEDERRHAAEVQARLERAQRVRVTWTDPDGGLHVGRVNPGQKSQWETEEKARWAAEKGKKAERMARDKAEGLE